MPFSCTDWASTFGLEYPVLQDQAYGLFSQFGFGNYPVNVILDRDMRIVYIANFFSQSALIAAIEEELAALAVVQYDSEPPLPDIAGYSIYPNPLNDRASIHWDSAKEGPIIMTLFDLGGRMVKQWPASIYPRGPNQIYLDSGDLQSGLYFLQLAGPAYTTSRKVIIMK